MNPARGPRVASLMNGAQIVIVPLTVDDILTERIGKKLASENHRD
jgi:hypothetical protein